MEKLEMWAKKLNNREYREELTKKEIDELEQDGIVAVFGASDDLCELRGAIIDEFGCWRGKTLVYVEEVECFLKNNYYDENPNELIKINLTGRPFLKISSYTRDGWKYELPDIPQTEFNILDNGEQYCEGKLFYWADFINS